MTIDIDPSSRTWQAVVAWAKEQIEQQRDQLEIGGKAPGSDDRHRGAIDALRTLIGLAGRQSIPRPSSGEDYHG